MRSELRIAFAYWLLSSIWITLSDLVLFDQNGNVPALPSSVKGILFITLSAGLLYWMLRRVFRKQEHLHQQALAAQMDFRTLFMYSPLPMWVYDLETLKFLDVNETTVREYGYTREEFLSMTALDIRPPEDVPRLLAHAETIRTSLQAAGEWRHLRKDGQLMDMEIVSRTFDYQGRKAVLAIGHNITEQKQARAALQEQIQLRTALSQEIELRNVRNRFISMVSHEFRSPLASMSTSLELLERYSDRMTPEKQRERHTHMRDQIRELTQLLDDVLILMKTDSVGLDFHAEHLDIVSLCQGVLEQIRQNDSQQHMFQFTTAMDTFPYEGDPKLLRSAVRNLLTNAVKYSPPQSTVSLDVSRVDGVVAIRVTDQGIGIPDVEQQRIFDPFFRATNAHPVPGTGLGMAITKQAVDAHQGVIELDSVAGKGSTFTIKLPVNGADRYSLTS